MSAQLVWLVDMCRCLGCCCPVGLVWPMGKSGVVLSVQLAATWYIRASRRRGWWDADFWVFVEHRLLQILENNLHLQLSALPPSPPSPLHSSTSNLIPSLTNQPPPTTPPSPHLHPTSSRSHLPLPLPQTRTRSPPNTPSSPSLPPARPFHPHHPFT